MRLRSRSLFVVLLGAAAAAFAGPPVSIPAGDLGAMAAEIEMMHLEDRRASPQVDNPGGITAMNAAIGIAINAGFAFADLLGNASAASSLLDKVIDKTLEPDADGYTRGSPDTPTSLCKGAGKDLARQTECEMCFEKADNNLVRARHDLERLRVAGLSTKNYVTTKLAVGDGLSGLTGLAALEWQRQRSGINKQFDKFKITYDGKYEEFMKGLQRAMARFDACESRYGEADWYNRFGFLYVQFMADKYKRNF